MVLTNIFQKGVAAQGSRLYTTMGENTDFIILKQGNTEVQSKYTKGDLKRASRKLEIAASIGLIIALALFVYIRFNFQITHTDSQSMVPTLSVSDIGFYGPVGEVERGDIILFDPTTEWNADLPMIQAYEGSFFTKRVIGLPGERVRMEDGVVYINDEPLNEPYAVYSNNPEPYRVTMRTMDEITVPEGCYFVMGDNRDHSDDSRVFGVIPRENITRTMVFSYPSLTGWITGLSNDDQFI